MSSSLPPYINCHKIDEMTYFPSSIIGLFILALVRRHHALAGFCINLGARCIYDQFCKFVCLLMSGEVAWQMDAFCWFICFSVELRFLEALNYIKDLVVK
jgi:hypothetical protein